MLGVLDALLDAIDALPEVVVTARALRNARGMRLEVLHGVADSRTQNVEAQVGVLDLEVLEVHLLAHDVAKQRHDAEG